MNRALVGFDFHFGGPPPAAMAPVHPSCVRLDASLEDLSPAPGVLRLATLQARVRAIRAIGAEPLVILDYTPAWLGQPAARWGTGPRPSPPTWGHGGR